MAASALRIRSSAVSSPRAAAMPMLPVMWIRSVPRKKGSARAAASRSAMATMSAFGVDPFRHHHELVAAEAGHGVARPQRPLEAPGQGHQQRVPGGMALG